jgi:hypothetical protein
MQTYFVYQYIQQRLRKFWPPSAGHEMEGSMAIRSAHTVAPGFALSAALHAFGGAAQAVASYLVLLREVFVEAQAEARAAERRYGLIAE